VEHGQTRGPDRNRINKQQQRDQNVYINYHNTTKKDQLPLPQYTRTMILLIL
jgi:hypothetical protein